MKSFLFSLLTLVNLPLYTNTALNTTISINNISYEVVNYNQVPTIVVDLAGVGECVLGVVVKAENSILENKNHQLTVSLQNHQKSIEFYSFTAANQTYNLEISLNGQNYNLAAISGSVRSFTVTSSTRVPATSFVKSINVNTNNVTSQVLRTFNFAALQKASKQQNRIFDLNRYVFNASNTLPEEITGVITLDGGLESEFCSSTTSCSLAVGGKIIDNNMALQLEGEYYYDRGQDKMTSNYLNNYVLVKPVLVRKYAKPLEMNITLNLNFGHTARINIVVTGISVIKEIYGNCETAMYCINERTPLSDLIYSKEVNYP